MDNTVYNLLITVYLCHFFLVVIMFCDEKWVDNPLLIGCYGQ
jgi:hypothetical protein